MYIDIQIVSVLGDCVLTNAVRMTNDSDCSGRVGQERTRAAANYISLDHCGSSSPSAGTWTQPPARTSSDRVQLFRQHSSPSHWMPLKCMSKSPNVHGTVSFLPYFSTVKLHEEGQKQIVTIIT